MSTDKFTTGLEEGDELMVDWYKYMNLYVVYPDAFKNGKKGDLESLGENVGYIKSLGFNAIHVLPFLKSPMLDAGFDVSNYLEVRKSLGGNVAFDGFLARAKKHKMRVFMDLVVNHVSNQHEWFKRAIAGEQYYRDFFIHTPEKPRLVKIVEDKRGRWVVYELARRILKARTSITSGKDELPHWTRGKDGFWYYHTFYSHQIDLNWTNREVVKVFGEIIKHWAKKGLSFRVDAAPFAGKSLSNLSEGSLGSHQVIGKLRVFAKGVNPESALLVEACLPTAKTKRYFGRSDEREAELAYNFKLMRGFWASLVSGNPSYVWKGIVDTKDIPEYAQWVTFLRNHDELSLEYAAPKVRRLVYDSLFKDGVEFRGEFGLAGRTASFLNKSVRRIVLAHLLLVSVNGVPALVYGDEVGKGTDKRYIKVDTRDSNRGSLTKKDFERGKGQEIRRQLSEIFQMRLKYPEIAKVRAERIMKGKTSILGLRYELKKGVLDVVVNLGKRKKKVKYAGGEIVLKVDGVVVEDESLILPGYSGVWVIRK